MDFARLFDFITLKKRFSGIAFAFCLLFAMQPAQASLIDGFDSSLLGTEILGGRFFVANDGDVTATFLGSDAGYFNTLYLSSPGDGDPIFIFDKDNSGSDFISLGSLLGLGSFDAGTELIFSLYVENTKQTFFTGEGVNNPGYNNPDDMAHARAVTTLTTLGSEDYYLTEVGFEDLYGGGDRDYNDFMFSLTNVIDPIVDVPEPRLLLLLSCGLFILTLFSRRRKILNSADI